MTEKKPAIVAPVMRHLGSADIPRTIAFYREVLGIGGAEFYIDNADALHAELRSKGRTFKVSR